MHRVRLSFTILSLAGMVLGIALWAWDHSPPTARAELGFGSADATTFEPSGLPSAPALPTSDQPAMSDPDAECPALLTSVQPATSNPDAESPALLTSVQPAMSDPDAECPAAMTGAETPEQQPVEQQAVPECRDWADSERCHVTWPGFAKGEKLPEGHPEVRSYGRPGDPYESPPIPRWPQPVKEALPEQVPDPFEGQALQLIPGFNPPPSGKERDYPNLTSELHALVDQHQREQGPAGEIPPLGIGKPTGEIRVTVTVFVAKHGGPCHLEGLRGFFHREGVTSMHFWTNFVEVTLPISLLGPLSSQKGVGRVEPIPLAILDTVVGQGGKAHGSPEWNLLESTGDGIKVGILDRGFDGFSGSWTNGDLPPADICRTGIPGEEAQDPPGTVPGADGRSDPLAASGGSNQAHVPQGRKGPPSLSTGRDAANSLCATLLQS